MAKKYSALTQHKGLSHCSQNLTTGPYPRRCDSSVSTVSDWTGVWSPAEANEFSFCLCVQTGWGPPSHQHNRSRGSFLGGKGRPWPLTPSSAKSKSYTSSPPWRVHGIAGQLYFYSDIVQFIWSQLKSIIQEHRILTESEEDSAPTLQKPRTGHVLRYFNINPFSFDIS
jgi:hypothetical protein